MVAACVWNDWLPAPLAAEIASEEPQRYAALVSHLSTQWHRDKAALGVAAAAEATLPFVPIAKSLINARAEPPAPALTQFAETLLDIVFCCTDDLVPQVRWAQQLHRLLRVHRRKLKVVVPWRPLHAMLRRHGMKPSAAYEGGGVAEARHLALVTLAHRCRRFFPAGSAAEMWEEWGPALADPQKPECFEALGWLALLLPTHEALEGEGEWGQWAEHWVHLWQTLDHCRYWDSLWYNLFSRLAKHDVAGLVDWPALLPRLFTRFMWAFEVPVGAATGSAPFSYPAPGLCQLLFNAEQKSRSGCIAKAAVYMLGRGGGTGEEESGGGLDDPVLHHLEAVVNLLEQYYHPSNGGRWSGTLSNFMKELTGHLCKRLVAEHYAATSAANGSDDESEDLADAGIDDAATEGEEQEVAGVGAVLSAARPHTSMGDAEDTSSGDEEAAVVVPAAAGAAARRHLTPALRRSVASLLLRLAGKAQFAKDKGSARVASQVLSALAHLAPDLVLPHVHLHFTTALETVTSASQLGTAIQTLSLCVRPLLVGGLPALAAPPEGPDETTAAAAAVAMGAVTGSSAVANSPPPATEEQRAAAAQAVCSALAATLPGIDANDEPKSLATFRFYCCVLGALGQLPASPTPALPLYTEEWVGELLSRCFAIIGNLDSPEHRGEHGGQGKQSGQMDEGSFLLDSNSMFRPLMELLIARLPPPLRRSAIKRIASFLLESTLTSVAAEASVLCNAAAWADPEYTAQVLLQPLVEALDRDLPAAAASAAGGGGARLSKAHEASLQWRLGLLSSTAFRSGRHLTPYRQQVVRVVEALAHAPSQSVQEASARAVGSMLSGLLSFYPTNQHSPNTDVLLLSGSNQKTGGQGEAAQGEGQGEGGEGGSLSIECCVDKAGQGGGQALGWHEASEEEISFAQELVRVGLLDPSARLLQLSSGNGGGEMAKEELKGLLLQIEGVLGGARTCLPDLPAPDATTTAATATAATGTDATAIDAAITPPSSHQPLCLIGRGGASLADKGAGRAAAARALLAAAGCVGAALDSDSLRQLVVSMDGVLAIGTSEYADSTSNLAAWNSDEKWMHEPAVAGLLQQEQGVEGCSTVGGTTVGSTVVGGSTVGGTTGGKGAVAKWRRRRPRWLVAEKVYLNLEWRASQAAYRPWASLDLPTPPLHMLPPLAIELVQQGVRFATHSYPEVREAAVSMLERAVKRYTCLAPIVLPPLLAALAKLPAEQAGKWGDTVQDLLPALQKAVKGAGAAAAAAAEGQPEPEAEQAGAIGACRVLEGRGLWRYISRDWHASRALMLGLLASAAHTGAEAQSAILRCFLITAFRLTTPTGRDPAAAAAMIRDVLAAAQQPALHWRYKCLAESALCMLLPLLDAETGAEVAQHWAALLTSDMLLLRQIAATGLIMLLLPLWRKEPKGEEGGERAPASGSAAAARALAASAAATSGGDVAMREADDEADGQEGGGSFRTGSGQLPPAPPLRGVHPAAVAAAAAALRQAVAADPPAFVASLFQQMAHGHPMLGGEGQQQRTGRHLLGMSRDDMMFKMVTKTLARAAIWPHGRESVPCLTREEFLATHAQLVQVLAVVVPECVPAFRQPLEEALGRAQDEDRPATAAAAEVLAGLLAVPAVYATGAWDEWVCGALKQALAGAPLENTDLWSSCTLRYAGHHLAMAELAGSADVAGCVAEVAGGEGAPPLAPASPLQLLVDAVAEPLPEGATSSQVYKRLTSLLLLAAEVATATGTAQPPLLLRRLQARLLHELPSLPDQAGENVRLAGAQLAAFVPCSILESQEARQAQQARQAVGAKRAQRAQQAAPEGDTNNGNNNGNDNGNGSNGGGSDAEMVVVERGAGSNLSLEALPAGDALLLVSCSTASLRRAAVAYMDGLVAQFDSSVDSMFRALRSGEASGHPSSSAAAQPATDTAGAGAAATAGAGGSSGGGATGPGASGLVAAAAANVASVEADMVDAEAALHAEGEEGDEEAMGVEEAAAAGGAEGQLAAVKGSPEYQTAVAHISFTVQIMVQALSGGEGPGLSPWLARMLGSLLRLQEVIPSELQFVSLEARKALVCFKYLPLPAQLVGPVMATLEQASTAELWPERGSALLFAQYFWFRHTFILGAEGTARVQAMVCAMLADSKLEVREMAATTLSGLIKGLPAEEAASLRRSFMDRALELFPAGKRRRIAGGGTAAAAAAAAPGGGASLAQRHAVVLGLKAFVLSSPYDVPAWLPDVLMALVRLAPEPPPLRTSVTKTLAEFRRTHEEAGLSEVRELLSAEQWEAIRDVASPASYFV